MKLIHCLNDKKNIYEFDTFDKMLIETTTICKELDNFVNSFTSKLKKDRK